MDGKVLGIERRRRWSKDEKARIVEETLMPEAVVSEVARRHGVAPSLLFTWRRLDPQEPPNVERNFDKRYRRYHDRLHRAGTIQGWLALAELCRTKSRLVAAMCLAFAGPVCGAFGYKAPGLQFVRPGRSDLGATTIGRVAATVWGGAVTPDPMLWRGPHQHEIGGWLNGIQGLIASGATERSSPCCCGFAGAEPTDCGVNFRAGISVHLVH
jgi:transposase